MEATRTGEARDLPADAAGNEAEFFIPVVFDEDLPGIVSVDQCYTPARSVFVEADAVKVLLGFDEWVRWSPTSDEWRSDIGVPLFAGSPQEMALYVEDLAGNTGDVIVTFAGEYSYWSTDSMWCVPRGATVHLPEGVEPGEDFWPDPDDPDSVPALCPTWLGSVTTGTGGIYQLPRSDEEERVLDWPYTYLSASGRFPPMGGWPDYPYFEAGVSIVAGPASASAEWWHMPPGMAEPETKELPVWAQATGGVIYLSPPTMSIRSRTPGLWPSSAHAEVTFYNEVGRRTVDGVCAARLRSIIAVKVKPDLVATGPAELFVEAWYDKEVEGMENVEVTFKKWDETAEVTPSYTKVVYPDHPRRDVLQGIWCKVDFTEPPGKDYTGLWNVYVNVGQVTEFTYEEAFNVVGVEFDNVWDRNLGPLDDELADYDKCIAVQHDAGGQLDLEQGGYLKIEPANLSYTDIKDVVTLKVALELFDSASMDGAVLKYDTGAPSADNIYAFGLGLTCVTSGEVLDRLIVVIYPGQTVAQHNTFVQTNTVPPGWLGQLPPVYSTLGPNNTDPEPPGPNQRWDNKVKTLDNNYHYNAVYEMRSEPIAGGQGHQACYDGNGVLLAATPDSPPEIIAAAGTVDQVSPGHDLTDHGDEDAWPFIRAAQLDGNPVEGGWFAISMTRPLIRVGDNLRDYYRRRPPHTDNTVQAGQSIPP